MAVICSASVAYCIFTEKKLFGSVVIPQLRLKTVFAKQSPATLPRIMIAAGMRAVSISLINDFDIVNFVMIIYYSGYLPKCQEDFHINYQSAIYN